MNCRRQLLNQLPLVLAKLATGNRFRIWQALQRQKHRRHAGAASLVINALDDLSGLLAEFQPVSSSMTFAGTDIDTWSSVAGSEPLTLTYYGDGGGSPALQPNAFGAGRAGVYFQGGKLTASVAWSPADFTAVWVGNVNAPSLIASFPRFVGLGNYGLFEEDWDSADTWVTGCFDAVNGIFVADRNGARPIAMTFDPAKNYLFATRKQAGTITAWLRPFGETTVTASGATDNVGLAVDTLMLGGNMVPQNLSGALAHVGLWGRALTDTEVLAALNYLGGIYE